MKGCAYTILLCTLAGSPMATAAGFPPEVLMPEQGKTMDLPSPWGIAVDGTNLYVTSYSGNYIAVFDGEGNQVRSFGSSGSGDGQLSSASGLTVDESHVYVTESGNHRIQVFTKDGLFVRKWGGQGTAQGRFDRPQDCCVTDGLLYVADRENHRIQVFETDGTFVNSWGQLGALPGEFNHPHGIVILREKVYVLDRQNRRMQVFTLTGEFVYEFPLDQATNSGWGVNYALTTDGAHLFVSAPGPTKIARIFVYDLDGNEVLLHQNSWSGSALPYNGDPLSQPVGLAFRDGTLYVADAGSYRVVPFRRAFRTPGSPASRTNSLPRAVVRSAVQRVGSGVVDIDFEVVDANSPTVTVHAIAFEGTATTLAKAIPMRTVVEGTETNLGSMVLTGVTNRLSWNASADWAADYGDVRMAFLCRDASRDLLDLHFLELPALNGNPAVTINRVAITQQDLLPIWIWLVAADDPAVRFDTGAVHGVGGAYDGILLANDSGTTTEGLAFLFARLGVREATAAELQYAREATTPGAVTKWNSRFQIDGRPTHVNEFCFDTGSTEGWFVVEE